MLLTLDRKEVEKLLRDADMIPKGYYISQITRGTGGIPNLKIYLDKKPLQTK